MSETYSDARSSCDDEQYQRHICAEESESMSLQRYTRPMLYALRNDARSLRRPECSTRCELQTLSFWKFSPVSGNNHENATTSTGVGNGVNDSSGSVGSSGVGQFSTSGRGRDRQINLRDRQMGYSRGIRSAGVDTSFSHANSSSQKASFIDQRSNSIAHLMPAFAKKRIAAAAAQTQNQSLADQASADYQDTRDNEGQRNTNYEGSGRPLRGKDLSFDLQRRGVNENADYISPLRRSLNEHERDSVGGGVNSRHGNVMHERRIGSGRLLPRDVNWEYHEKNNLGSQQRNSSRFSVSNSSGYQEKNSFDRGNSGSATVNEKFNSNTHSGNRRYNLDEHVRPHRNSFKDKNDEPEWFSGGPTSQNDIIELRGFDEPIEDNDNDRSSENQTRARKLSTGEESNAELSQSSSNYELTSSNLRKNGEGQKTIRRASVEAVAGAFPTSGENKNHNEPTSGLDENEQIQKKADMSKEFNFDAFFNLDSLESEIIHSGTDEMKKDKTSGGSRFSRWFANSNDPEEDPDVKSPDILKHSPKAANVLEFFQNAKIGYAGLQKLEMPSVKELEAKMRKVDMQEKPTEICSVSTDEQYMVNSENASKNPVSQDMEAFKKLLQQLNSGGPKKEVLGLERVPHCVSPPHQGLGIFPTMGLIPPEMSTMVPPMMAMPPGGPLPTNPDEIIRVNQMQQHRFPAIPPSQPMEMSPNAKHPFMGENFVDHQKRRDFVNLLHAVKRGQIPLAILDKELNNPNIPIPTKEVITAVIRETTRSLTPSLNMLNNNQAQLAPVHLMRGSPVLQQGIHSPTQISNLQPPQIPGHTNQMVPQQTHPVEQMPHTGTPIGMSNIQDPHMRSQAMMQNVMINKKTEEQQQDANRRQNEFQTQPIDNPHMQMEQQSPLHQVHAQNSVTALGGHQARHLNSPTPLAFTPTSVLRKMTAEKDNASPQMQQQSQQLHKLLPHMQNKPLNHGAFLNQSQHQQQQQQLPSAIAQPRMILGGNHPTSQIGAAQHPPHTQHTNQSISPQTLPPMPPNLQHQQQQQQQQQQRIMPNDAKWQMNLINQQAGMPPNKPMGRPILKGPTPSITMPIPQQTQHSMQILGHLQSPSQQNPQVPSMMFPGKLDMPQHRLKNNQTPQHMLNPQPSPQGFVSGQQLQQHLQQPVPQNVLHMQHQQMFQLHHMSLQQQQHMQLQRQLHQQMHAQPNVHLQQQQKQQHETTSRLVNFTQSQQTPTNSTNNAHSNATPNICPREGGLSPTSNQLAQWFSPELLAQASAGKLPQINMNQALSLEEFERNIQQHSSTVVHN